MGTSINTIYILRNTVNKKVYVGQTWQALQERWYYGRGYKNSIYLDRAIKKYGKGNFYYEILDFAFTQAQADMLEIFYIDKYNSTNVEIGYNISVGGANSVMRGRKHSEASKNKMSESHKGIKKSEQEKLEISKKLIGNKNGVGNKNHLGHKHSEDAKNKMSKSLKGRKVWNKGKSVFCGEDNPRSKTTEKIILEIRKDYVSGNYTQIELSKKYNISPQTINKIVTRKTWKHI